MIVRSKFFPFRIGLFFQKGSKTRLTGSPLLKVYLSSSLEREIERKRVCVMHSFVNRQIGQLMGFNQC